MNAPIEAAIAPFARDFLDAPGRFSPVADAPTSAELVERARAMVPDLAATAQRTEEARRVSDAATARFREADFFRMMQPARYGGYEFGFTTFVDVISELGRGCASSSWGCSLGAVHQWLMGLFPAEAQDDVWGANPEAIACVSYAPAVKAEPAPGGCTVAGKWLWCSNVDNSQWAMLGTMLPPSDAIPQPHPGFLLVPRTDWEIEDDWFVSGQAGTGSKAVVIAKPTFVPAHRVLTFAQASSGAAPGLAVNLNPIYRIPFLSAVPTCLVSPILGAAQGAIDAFVAHAAVRVTRGAVAGGGNRLCDFFPVQQRLGEATACLDAARLLIYRDTADVERRAALGESVGIDLRIRNRRDHSFATRLAREAVDALFACTGGAGLALSQPIQRFWRDAHAISKHISLNWDVVGSMTGQHLLGLEPRGQY